MRFALRSIGIIFLLLLLVLVIAVGWHWTTLKHLRVAQSGSVTEVEKFQPRQIVKGCGATELPRYDQNNPLSPATVSAMNAYSADEGGVGLMVLVHGRIAAESYREGASMQTRAFSFSMHKSVLALAYGAALAEGIIASIDDPIGKYLSEWADDSRGEIPLRAFLTMSSGLEKLQQTEWRSIQFNFSDHVTDIALDLQPTREPFTQFYYKNTDSQLAGAALSRALQAHGEQDYASFLSSRIWCPIGAQDALLWPEKPGGDPRFYAFLDARLRDWARVGLLVMNQGTFAGKQIVPGNWIEAIETPSVNNPRYGIQTWLGSPYEPARSYAPDRALQVPQAEPYVADDVVFFDGFGGQRVYIVRSAGLVIVRSGEVSFTWDDGVLVNLALNDLQ